MTEFTRQPAVAGATAREGGALYNAPTKRQPQDARHAMHTADIDAPAQGDTGFDLSSFIRSLAHEIANPLNAMTMNSELVKLLIERGDTARAREALERLVADCARCGKLVRGLQRFGSGLRVQSPDRVALRDLVDGAIAALALEYSDPMPAWRLDVADIEIVADRAGLERALTGLLRNAAEAGADVVEIGARIDDGFVVVEVRDNGAGFGAEDLGRVADPFYSTRRGVGSLGLGLALAREQLRRHGGGLAIFHNAPRGAHVEMRLPASLVLRGD
ncbi:MAG TPA: HAMP domain-containing sensor histidine kinase [Rudaea sp.]|nr:HAMP domain-containing sensor histidine kinase [Rudaea sp.]